ncbi:ATP-binding protein [Pantanalinema rosaneae CENA516]|uniref:ATP-binding protein n=1 Tax=Pantanalinema rosaneae TaxID=1620701 RepID=UPI003D6DE966
MSQHTACLPELIELLPTCSTTATLATVLAEFSRIDIDRLVVINPQYHPIGVVRLPTLMSYVLTVGLGQSVLRVPSSEPILATPLLQLEPTIVESVLVLSADLTLEQLLGQLQISGDGHYAFVDRQGHYLGLLNQTQLLRVLTANLLTAHPPAAIASGFTPLGGQTGHLGQGSYQPQQQPIIFLMQQLLTQKKELEQQIQLQQQIIHHLQATHPPLATTDPFTHTSEATASTALLELFDRLPLPLMLQTNQGQVVVQNLVWQEQVGELLEPECVGRDAANVLETSEMEAPTPTGVPDPEFPQPFGTTAADPRLAHAPLCYSGTKPNTCICVCALKNGQERIWQFIKIPLGAVLPKSLIDSSHWSMRLTELDDAEAAEQASCPFRLATLTSTQPAEVGEASVASVEPPEEMLWLILAQDVTEQQQLARELTAKNADLVQLNRLKDEFLACISHELKTPLTAVLGLSSLLKDQTLGQLNQRQIHYAQLIYQSGRHLMTVVNDILDLTRIETGQLDLVFEPVNIPSVCSRAFDQAKQLWLVESKQDLAAADDCPIAQFSLEIEPGLETIVADELRLRQILVHLLSNALKFTEPDNPIGLKVGRWGGWIAFTVWDTGIGIPADKQHLIFQKFQQLENPLTRRFEGTGLGLVLTQRLARLHGGDVTFLSKESQGSQFTVLLPPAPAQPTRPSRLSDPDDLSDFDQTFRSPTGRVPLHTRASVGSSQRSSAASLSPSASRAAASSDRLVLVVEAAPPSIEALSEQLTGLGYRVVIARSGTEALEKARRLQPCIIFLNPLLPLLSGWDVLTLLKSNLETRQIPVVVTATTVDQEEARHSHANGFLSMPIAPKALQTVLQQFVAPSSAPKSRPTSSRLTILRLSPPLLYNTHPSPWHGSTLDLNQLLHSHHYRVLEADDLEQAELLARVWKPDVILLDRAVPNPDVYFQQFSHHTFLAALPLVLLDPATTQAANQIPGLLVFPCLAAPDTKPFADGDPEVSAVLRVVQVAAGYVWRPTVLAIDLATLPLSPEATTSPTPPTLTLGSLPQEAEWLQALMQYLQTAGFSGSIARSWQEVLYQVQSQSIDLLLIGCTTPELPGSVIEQLLALHDLAIKPPVLVLDHRYSNPQDPPRMAIELPAVIQQLATQILTHATPMPELLHYIQQIVTG